MPYAPLFCRAGLRRSAALEPWRQRVDQGDARVVRRGQSVTLVGRSGSFEVRAQGAGAVGFRQWCLVAGVDVEVHQHQLDARADHRRDVEEPVVLRVVLPRDQLLRRRRGAEAVVEEARGKCKVIAHTGHHSPNETIDLTRHAQEADRWRDRRRVLIPKQRAPLGR